MSSDPHDQLLLTERPTTIVTQHTASMDSMPTPYGTQEDEEAMFSDVGSDAGMARNAGAISRNADGTESRISTVTYDGDELAAVDVGPAVTDGLKSMGIVIAIGLLGAYLLARK